MERKTIIKSSLLVVAVIISISAILYYKHTVVDPPRQFDFENQHDKTLVRTIKFISSDSLENRYADCRYLLRRLIDENLIDENIGNKRLEDLAVKYTPLFIKRCNQAFSVSTWDTPAWSHSFMRYRIEELKNLKNSHSSYIIERASDYILQMDSVNNIMSRYDKAWALSEQTFFISIRTTKNSVSQALLYKKDDKLKNCTALVQALDALPNKIKDSHLYKLTNAVNRLYCFGLDDYNRYLSSLENLYNNKLEEFIEYYGSNTEIISLKKSLRNQQYTVLESFVDHAINVNNFNNYSGYSSENTIVDGYIKTYLGSASDQKTLMDKLANNSLSENEFDNRKQIYW